MLLLHYFIYFLACVFRAESRIRVDLRQPRDIRQVIWDFYVVTDSIPEGGHRAIYIVPRKFSRPATKPIKVDLVYKTTGKEKFVDTRFSEIIHLPEFTQDQYKLSKSGITAGQLLDNFQNLSVGRFAPTSRYNLISNNCRHFADVYIEAIANLTL